MGRTFLLLNQLEHEDKIMESIKSREQEIAAYDFEHDAHAAAITALGNISWDQSNIKYRGMPREALIATALADGLTSEQLAVIYDLIALDQSKANLEAVKIERGRSERIYAHLLNTIPTGKSSEDAVVRFQKAETVKAAEKEFAELKLAKELDVLRKEVIPPIDGLAVG
jgi:hypothetical protein